MIHCCSFFFLNLFYFYMDYWKSGIMLRSILLITPKVPTDKSESCKRMVVKFRAANKIWTRLKWSLFPQFYYCVVEFSSESIQTTQ